VQALDLAYKPILSPTGLEAFSEILWPLSSTEVRCHVEKRLTSDKFPLVCIDYDLGHFDSHHGRFIQSLNKICLLAEVSVRVVGPLRHYIFIDVFYIVDALVLAWDAGRPQIYNRNLVQTTANILRDLAHWTKFKAPAPNRFGSSAYFGGAGEIGWWFEWRLFGGLVRGARSVHNQVRPRSIFHQIYSYTRLALIHHH